MLLRLTVLACVMGSSLFGSSLLLAQTPIRVVGELVPNNGPTICGQQLSHRLACSRVYLVSQSVNLNAFNGQIVDLVGIDQGVTCVVLNVSQIQLASGSLSWSGTPTLGSTLTFVLTGPGISYNGVYLSNFAAVIPLDLQTGTLLIAPPLYFLSGSAGGGQSQFSVTIPVDPALIGATPYLQSVHQTIGPVRPPFLGNPICFTVT